MDCSLLSPLVEKGGPAVDSMAVEVNGEPIVSAIKK
jgi:hypothetical protein